MFALVDCNNFYVSCERVFDPSLEGEAVVVATSDQGCIVARSNEAKKLGVPMGAPLFKVRDLLKQHSVIVLNGNYSLYGDMSHRVMNILRNFTDELEIYSIDEAFLNLENFTHLDLTGYGKKLRGMVMKWTGIPVSVGIAPTKTMAKLANHIAKKNEQYQGAFNTLDVKKEEWENMLSTLPVSEIWGIGRNLSSYLNRNGIYTVLEFMNAPEAWVRKKLTVAGLRTQTELKGVSCIKIEHVKEPSKGIISSRTFGETIESYKELSEAVSTFTTIAANKLRKEKGVASVVYVTVKTNKHKKNQEQYFGVGFKSLTTPSSFTPELIKCALAALKDAYKKGYRYKRAGVMLAGIIPDDQTQISLFEQKYNFEKREKVMKAFDELNRELGFETLKFASSGLKKGWSPKTSRRSKRYTTKWEEIKNIN